MARYDGPGHNTEECRSIAVDGSGNVYVAGFSYGEADHNMTMPQ
ncbi:MAG: SBBP repeat-containing protein [Ignavibacteria bacterium]|nr:SBBP repeat-containing protein [Ignavibacteria bacterium]